MRGPTANVVFFCAAARRRCSYHLELLERVPIVVGCTYGRHIICVYFIFVYIILIIDHINISKIFIRGYFESRTPRLADFETRLNESY